MNPSSFGIFHTTFPQSCSFITSFKWMQKVWKHRTNTKSCYLLFNITINRWKNIKWDQKKTLILILTLNSMIELLSNIRKLQISSIVWLIKTIMQCLFKEVYQCYISSKMLPYQSAVAWKYWCLIESGRTGIPFQNNLHIFKMLIMFDMQYWKCNNIYSTWRMKKKLKI